MIDVQQNGISVGSDNPTQTQANLLRLGIALSQTAYSSNNGGGLSVGKPCGPEVVFAKKIRL